MARDNTFHSTCFIRIRLNELTLGFIDQILKAGLENYEPQSYYLPSANC